MPRTSTRKAKVVVKHLPSSDDEDESKSEGDTAIKVEDTSSTDELPPPPPQRRRIPKKEKRRRSPPSSSRSSDIARSSGASSGEPAAKRQSKDRGRHERPRSHVHRHGDPAVQYLIDTRELRYVVSRYKRHREEVLKRLNKIENTCCCSGCLRERVKSDKYSSDSSRNLH